MSQGYGTFGVTGGTPPKTKGWMALAIGLICMLLLAPASFGAGLWLGVQRGTDALGGEPWTASAPKQLDASKSYVVFADSSLNTQNQGQCGALDPAGTKIDFTSSTGNLTINDQSQLGKFTSTTAGAYQLQCGNASLRVIGEAQAQDIAKNVGIPVLVGTGGAVLLGLLGLILTIVGIVRLVSSNSRRKHFQMGQQGGQPGWGPGPQR